MADPGTEQSAESEGLPPEELESLRAILDSPAFAAALAKDPDVLSECLEIAEFGSAIDADEDVVEAALLDYLKKRNPASFQRALKRILQKTHGLPEPFVALGSGIEDLMGLAAKAQAWGDDDYEIFRDERNLEALKGGVAAAEREVLAPAISRTTGIPLDVVRGQPLKKSVKGAEFAQQIGYPGALKDPEFWSDLDQPGPRIVEKWRARAADQEAKERAQMDREINEKLRQYQEALIDQELERRRARRALARKMKAKKRRARRRRRLKAELVMPSEFEIVRDRQVATPSGTNYVLRAYPDDTSELYRVEPEGWRLVLPRARHGYVVSRHEASGLPLVVPVLGSSRGRRRASPLDTPRSGPGPTGL